MGKTEGSFSWVTEEKTKATICGGDFSFFFALLSFLLFFFFLICRFLLFFFFFLLPLYLIQSRIYPQIVALLYAWPSIYLSHIEITIYYSILFYSSSYRSIFHPCLDNPVCDSCCSSY